MSPLAAPAAIAGSLSASHGSDRAQLAQAARQFEAIFVRQMLAAARKTKFDDASGDQGMDTFHAMQDDRFAEIASDTGAFGLAKMIETQLGAQLSPSRSRMGTGEDSPSGPAQQVLPQPTVER